LFLNTLSFSSSFFIVLLFLGILLAKTNNPNLSFLVLIMWVIFFTFNIFVGDMPLNTLSFFITLFWLSVMLYLLNYLNILAVLLTAWLGFFVYMIYSDRHLITIPIFSLLALNVLEFCISLVLIIFFKNFFKNRNGDFSINFLLSIIESEDFIRSICIFFAIYGDIVFLVNTCYVTLTQYSSYIESLY